MFWVYDFVAGAFFLFSPSHWKVTNVCHPDKYVMEGDFRNLDGEMWREGDKMLNDSLFKGIDVWLLLLPQIAWLLCFPFGHGWITGNFSVHFAVWLFVLET